MDFKLATSSSFVLLSYIVKSTIDFASAYYEIPEDMCDECVILIEKKFCQQITEQKSIHEVFYDIIIEVYKEMILCLNPIMNF